jgi:hypothetical protein
MGWLFTTHQATAFLEPLPGKSGRPLQGEFLHTHLYFVLSFALLLPASFYIKNPKKLESLVVVISFSSSC